MPAGFVNKASYSPPRGSSRLDFIEDMIDSWFILAFARKRRGLPPLKPFSEKILAKYAQIGSTKVRDLTGL